MEFKIKVIENGGLAINLTLLYLLLKRGALLRGPYLYVNTELTSIDELINVILNHKDVDVPTINFCPSDEPTMIYEVDSLLARLCSEVYKYFDDRCAACVVKVYSILFESWLFDEVSLIRLFEAIIRYGLPTEFSNGSLVITTCPANYEDVSRLAHGTYVEGIDLLKRFANDFLSSSL